MKWLRRFVRRLLGHTRYDEQRHQVQARRAALRVEVDSMRKGAHR